MIIVFYKLHPLSGSSSSGRATASQAVGSGFEPRLPLFYLFHLLSNLTASKATNTQNSVFIL